LSDINKDSDEFILLERIRIKEEE